MPGMRSTRGRKVRYGRQRFKETVDFQGKSCIEGMDHTEDLGGHPVFLQQAVSVEGSLETAFPSAVWR